ncbi:MULTISPECIES: hypothetical protein [unclassified Bacillus cereus group]|uniref:hypothetical protein n=1 Tax=unclassified Bacillus cereus group TaxID=2750818 RepID=UPI000942DAED|nr:MULTISPECIES: hypothetical protein [unclassified Bacillus cereus group]MDA1581899.1 hypothetical protein [Bacillus cereus group sp. TH228LC]MDA1641820.1 hypothetical protein [Bacillus cereus group sp. TH177-1LC]
MLENLIANGEKLESEVQEGMAYKFFDSVNFEAWVSKSVLYLENYHPNSSITKKATAQINSLTSNTNYNFYKFLLGSLKAINEFENEQISIDFV